MLFDTFRSRASEIIAIPAHVGIRDGRHLARYGRGNFQIEHVGLVALAESEQCTVYRVNNP